MARHRQMGPVSGFTRSDRDGIVLSAKDSIDPEKHLQAETAGSVLLYDASGDPLVLGPGSDGQVLYTRGADATPSMGWMVRSVHHSTVATEYVQTGGNITKHNDWGVTLPEESLPVDAVRLIYYQCEVKANGETVRISLGSTSDRAAHYADQRISDLDSFGSVVAINGAQTTYLFGLFHGVIRNTGTAIDLWSWGDASFLGSSWVRNQTLNIFDLFPNP